MTPRQEAILRQMRDIIQVDVGNRGLARDPHANLFTATADDFVAACRSIAETKDASILIVTGFFIPHGRPPAAETDGPLGAVFLVRALAGLGIGIAITTEEFCFKAIAAVLTPITKQKPINARLEIEPPQRVAWNAPLPKTLADHWFIPGECATHVLALERPGANYTPEALRARPSTTPDHVADFEKAVSLFDHDRCFAMSGRDITGYMQNCYDFFTDRLIVGEPKQITSIGIGDGGNEIGMGKIPWDVIRRNIPRGDLVACRVPTDHLIVAGVSNWGAYALAAGVRLLRNAPYEPTLFDVDSERRTLEMMVEDGPLVDGVTGAQTATVDGLDFDSYAKPLRQLDALLKEAL